jgi:hypothetical protein
MITLNALITAVGLTSLVIATRIRRCTPEAIFGFALREKGITRVLHKEIKSNCYLDKVPRIFQKRIWVEA